MRTGELGFWWRSLEVGGVGRDGEGGGGGARSGGAAEPGVRAPLPGPTEADVAIVGAGYTGLWTAYYLKQAQPSLRIVVLEAERVGYGASGRNGGWATGFFSGPPRAYERTGGRRGAGGGGDGGSGGAGGRSGFMDLQRRMFATVDEIAGVLARERIDADFVKGGHLTVALDAAQAERLRAHVRHLHTLGLDDADVRELSGEDLQARVNVAGVRLATFSPHAARLHPAKLVAGLAAAAERAGVSIHERTPVLEIAGGRARTALGDVRARWVVRATEGYTRSLRGQRRALVPMNSSMIVTEPLGAAFWQEVGWHGEEVLEDNAHVFVYLQRTADGRIAIGGRGMPYRYGSRTDGAGDTARATVRELRAKLAAMFPQAADAALDHAWSGVLGVARDWCVSVGAEPATGTAWAGGYVGQGVAASNLAARTLRDLLLGEDTALTGLPWVARRRARRWEPEPLRWCAIRGVYSLYRRADAIERRSGRPSALARLIDGASGRQ